MKGVVDDVPEQRTFHEVEMNVDDPSSDVVAPGSTTDPGQVCLSQDLQVLLDVDDSCPLVLRGDQAVSSESTGVRTVSSLYQMHQLVSV